MPLYRKGPRAHRMAGDEKGCESLGVQDPLSGHLTCSQGRTTAREADPTAAVKKSLQVARKKKGKV